MGLNEIYIYARNNDAEIQFSNFSTDTEYVYYEELNVLFINSNFEKLIADIT